MKLKHILREYDATDGKLPAIADLKPDHRLALVSLQKRCLDDIRRESPDPSEFTKGAPIVVRLNHLTYTFFYFAYTLGDKSIQYRKHARVPDKPKDIKTYKDVVEYAGKIPTSIFDKEYLRVVSDIKGELTDLQNGSIFEYTDDDEVIDFLELYFGHNNADGSMGNMEPDEEANAAIEASGIPQKYIVYNQGGVVIIAAASKRMAMALGSNKYFTRQANGFCISREDCENAYDFYTHSNGAVTMPYFMFNFNVENEGRKNESYQNSVFMVSYSSRLQDFTYMVTRGDNAHGQETKNLKYEQMVNLYVNHWGYHDPALDFIKTIGETDLNDKADIPSSDVADSEDNGGVGIDDNGGAGIDDFSYVYDNVTKITGRNLYMCNCLVVSPYTLNLLDWRTLFKQPIIKPMIKNKSV
jgi:hypothetical protein